MTARMLDGASLAQVRREALLERVTALTARGIAPSLAAVGVGDDPGWAAYRRGQEKSCRALGIHSREVHLSADATQAEVDAVVYGLGKDPTVHGILVQSPLPAPLLTSRVHHLITPAKDVEAVNPASLGLLFSGKATMAPCTALAALLLAKEALPDLRGVEVVVVGASAIVGRPLAQMLLNEGATVTVCHILTKDLLSHTRRADLLVCAAGKAALITPAMVKPGVVVIDVGINRLQNPDGTKRLVGDADPAVAQVASAMTPVPGGVGVLTSALLMEAVVTAAEGFNA